MCKEGCETIRRRERSRDKRGGHLIFCRHQHKMYASLFIFPDVVPDRVPQRGSRGVSKHHLDARRSAYFLHMLDTFTYALRLPPCYEHTGWMDRCVLTSSLTMCASRSFGQYSFPHVSFISKAGVLPKSHTRRETCASRPALARSEKGSRTETQNLRNPILSFSTHDVRLDHHGGAGSPSVSRLLHLHSFGREAVLEGDGEGEAREVGVGGTQISAREDLRLNEDRRRCLTLLRFILPSRRRKYTFVSKSSWSCFFGFLEMIYAPEGKGNVLAGTFAPLLF